MDVQWYQATVSTNESINTCKLQALIIIHKTTENSDKKSECSQDQLVAIGNRLLDWFSVIMFDSKKKPSYHKSVKGKSHHLIKLAILTYLLTHEYA